MLKYSNKNLILVGFCGDGINRPGGGCSEIFPSKPLKGQGQAASIFPIVVVIMQYDPGKQCSEMAENAVLYLYSFALLQTALQKRNFRTNGRSVRKEEIRKL